MKKFKTYFLDLDGTLLNSKDGKKYITTENLHAVKEAINKGINIVVSTGRLKDFALTFLQETNIEYAVCGNGSQIINSNGDTLLQWNITNDSLEKIKHFIIEHDLSLKINQIRVAHNVSSDHSIDIAKRLNYKFSDNKNFQWEKDGTYKIIVWGKSKDDLDVLIKKMNLEINDINATSAERGLTIEITHKKATKAHGNMWILNNILSNNSLDECAHIGDTMNDASVIEVFKYFIAPCDSEEELLKISPYIGPSHHDHCVSKILDGNFWKNKINK